MNRWAGLFSIFCWAHLSYGAHIAKNLDPCGFLPNEIIIHIMSYGSIEDLFHFGQVSKRWKALADSDDLWQKWWQQVRRPQDKINEGMSLKQLYRAFNQRSITICHNHALNENQNEQPMENEFCRSNMQIITNKIANNLTTNEFLELFEKQLADFADFPEVILSDYSLLNANENNDIKSFTSILQIAAEHDILLVFPAGNQGLNISNDELKDFNSTYQNVCIVGYADKNNQISPFSCYGYPVNLAVHGILNNASGTAASAFLAARVFFLMRSERPDLKAADIIKIVLDTANRNEETKIKIPNGGILNCENAFSALKNYRR
jgi:hypothetical protein